MNNGMTAKTNKICTIVLPVYNSARYLNYTILSVLQQTMPDFEILAIDDGSIDHSLQILQYWAAQDERIRIVCNKKNKGVAQARNLGIEQAAGTYIAFLDSDDTWQNDKLAQQIDWLEQTDCDFCCTAYTMIDENSVPIKNRFLQRQQITMADLLRENYICCSSVLLRTTIAKQYSMDSSYAHEDYVYWLNLLQNDVKGCVLNQCLTNYRLVQTSRSANKRKAAQGRWQIYRRYLGYGLIRSGWYFAHYAVNGMKKYRKGKNK